MARKARMVNNQSRVMTPGRLGADRLPAGRFGAGRFAAEPDPADPEPADLPVARADLDPDDAERDDPDLEVVPRLAEPPRVPEDRAGLRAPPDEPEAARERDEVGVFVAMAPSLTRGCDIAAALPRVSDSAMPQ